MLVPGYCLKDLKCEDENSVHSPNSILHTFFALSTQELDLSRAIFTTSFIVAWQNLLIIIIILDLL